MRRDRSVYGVASTALSAGDTFQVDDGRHRRRMAPSQRRPGRWYLRTSRPL
jgi:hypothetical protein